MGNICGRVEVNGESISPPTRKSSSFLLDKISKKMDFRKKYEFISILGSGTYGTVYLYRDRQCKMLRAIKTIRKNFFNAHHIKSIIREVDILRSLDHPNIVNYFETYEDEGYLHIVMEYIGGSNLFKMITNKRKSLFTEKDASAIIKCLLKTVLFLHLKNIIHRDIKPENILFAIEGNYDSLRLIDFGLSIQRTESKEQMRVGTPYYMAPEMIEGNFVFQSDIWSIGVILYTMITGKPPFKARKREELFSKILYNDYNVKTLKATECSYEVKDLIRKMLIKNPKKRIEVASAIEHPWFKKFEFDNNENKVINKEIIDSLKNFQKQNLLQKEILFYLARISNEKEIEKLKEAFMMIDKDNSGTIEFEEIPRIFKEQGIQASNNEIQKIFNSLDFRGNGKVNYTEFLAASLSSIQFFEEEKLWSAFKYFDTNDTGYITYDSVIEALRKSHALVDEKGLEESFKKMQKEGKKINFEEFKKLVKGETV